MKNIFSFKSISSIFTMFFIFIILFTCLFTPTVSSSAATFFETNSKYAWPAPNYNQISSYFGKRISPTTGASTYHKGIDIPAPNGTPIIAIADGTISYCGFLGGGGYTITLSFDNIKASYCHCSPQYIVSVGNIVTKGQVIGYIGPKNVYGVKGNTYRDNNRKSNKWCYYWSTFTFWN